MCRAAGSRDVTAAAAGEVWSRGRLDAFPADPEAMFPGMWVTSRGIADPSDRKALTDFLADPKSR